MVCDRKVQFCLRIVEVRIVSLQVVARWGISACSIQNYWIVGRIIIRITERHVDRVCVWSHK